MGTRGPLKRSNGTPATIPALTAPAWLQGDAVTMFPEIVDGLVQAGVNLAAVDADAIARLADLRSKYVRLTAAADQNPKLTGALGTICDKMLRLEQALGLNPSARARLQSGWAAEPEPDDPLLEFVRQGTAQNGRRP